MPGSPSSTLIRLLKPIVLGVGLAYLVTAFVDKPTPVIFQPENPYASEQQKIVEPQLDVVMQKNVMKLGSPFSVSPDKGVDSSNPLSALEELESGEVPETESVQLEVDNATEIRVEIDEGNATQPTDELPAQ